MPIDFWILITGFSVCGLAWMIFARLHNMRRAPNTLTDDSIDADMSDSDIISADTIAEDLGHSDMGSE